MPLESALDEENAQIQSLSDTIKHINKQDPAQFVPNKITTTDQ